MAYVYVKAIALPRTRGSKWVEVNIANSTIKTILETYLNVKVEVSHFALSAHHILDLNAALALMPNQSLTLSEWFTSLGNTALPTTEGVVTIYSKSVKYRDGWLAGYDVSMAKMGSHPSIPWPAGDKRDLLLSKTGVDYQDFVDHCLVTVNGLIHRISSSEYGVYVVDGAYSKSLSNKTQLGILSFKDIGTVTTIDANKDMLYRPNINGKHYNYAYVDLGVSTENKTVLMVLGGYLHVLDSSYKSIGDGLIRIDFNNLPLMQRYYESKDYIDLDSLPRTKLASNEDQLITEEIIASDAYIEALLDLNQTFFVIVDVPHMYINKHLLEFSGLPGTFYSPVIPTWPLLTQRGKLKEYWATNDDGVWVINCDSNLVPNYVFETGPYQDQTCVTPNRVPNEKYYYDRGYLLEIGCDV